MVISALLGMTFGVMSSHYGAREQVTDLLQKLEGEYLEKIPKVFLLLI